MGRPIDFAEANFTWKGWPESDSRSAVSDLPSWRDGDRTISCWGLTLRERLLILATGRVWLHVIGRQPPVHVGGKTPFQSAASSRATGQKE